MKILIDTHIAIWAVLNDPKLPERAKNMILDEANEIFYNGGSGKSREFDIFNA